MARLGCLSASGSPRGASKHDGSTTRRWPERDLRGLGQRPAVALFRRWAGDAGTVHAARRSALCRAAEQDRKSTRLNSSHANISYAVFCLKKKKNNSLELTNNVK